jgi:hypothetical protein
MAQNTEIKTIRFLKSDTEKMAALKKIGVSPTRFLRMAFRQQFATQWPALEKNHQKLNKEKLPF